MDIVSEAGEDFFLAHMSNEGLARHVLHRMARSPRSERVGDSLRVACSGHVHMSHTPVSF
eukprot:8287366-Alexandrium_andersonii.AAC.1